MSETVRIAIPRALFYYFIYPFWGTFWRELGCQVVVSPPTTKAILDAGVREAVTDACVPVKVYYGHVMYLAEKADFLFIPRLVNVQGRLTFCPKFLGLRDLVKHSVGGIPPLISPRIDRGRSIFHRLVGPWARYQECVQAAQPITGDRQRIRRAYLAAARADRLFNRLLGSGLTPQEAIDHVESGYKPPTPGEADLTLAVLGYPYVLYDGYVSVGIIPRLRKMGVRVLVPDSLSPKQLKKFRPDLPKELFWHFSERNVRSATAAFHQGRIDGIIHVTAFGCGPDFMVNKFIELETKHRGIPFLSVSIDEQSGEAGIVTRLEAFADMLRRRRLLKGEEVGERVEHA